jgi:hypothetical protein
MGYQYSRKTSTDLAGEEKIYLFGLPDYYKSQKKSDYVINTDRSKMLDSGFFESQAWGALYKA